MATRAESADRYDLYQRSVQGPTGDIEFFVAQFLRLRNREPRHLREDFSGTALLSTEWVKSGPERSARAVDICEEALAWGEAHNLASLEPEQRRRIEMLRADVREVGQPPVDIVCAMNFSFCFLEERAELVDYFRRVKEALVPDGIFFGELYGGTEAIIASEEERECEGFNYHWEQESYNPITHRSTCSIHFSFPDGSRLDRAFTYSWRLWTLPEVRDCLMEAGFSDMFVFWEQTDEEGSGTGEFLETTEEENQETWLVYIVAPV